MAGAIRGITVEIGGDTTKLGKALSDVNSKTKSLQNELKGVNTLLKMDPGNVTLLKQKQDLLNESIANTKEKLNTLKEAQAQVQAQFDKGEVTEEQYRDFQREIVATEKKLEGLTDQLKEFGSVGAQQIALAGEKMQEFGGKVEDVGKKASVVSAGIVAIGGACVGAFYELDEGYDTIITKTGATGEALDSLTESADNVFANMPVEMADVGTAIGEVNTRFGYTGTELEDLSSKFLQFANINEVDLNNSIGMTDKILEQFNMSGKEAGGVLDLITKKAQETGIGADTLMKLIQDNGATFKDMGIGVNEAVVLLSQFEANGVNVETALKGLKKSTVEYAKEGLSMEEGLAKTIDSIKNAKTETEALAEVEKIFGSKGANEMVKAIREGRISVDDLSASMGDYAGTVENTFGATLDPIDEAKVGFNNLKLVGAELGDTIQVALLPLINGLVDGLKKLNNWFSQLSPTTKTIIVVIAGIVASIGPMLIIIGKLISSVGTIMTVVPKLVTGFKAVGTAFKSLGAFMSANPIAIIIIAITALVAGFIYLWKNCEGFRNFFIDLWEKIKNATKVAVDAIVNFFTVTIPEKWNAFITFCSNFINKIVTFFAELPGKIWTWLLGVITKISTWITNTREKMVNGVKNIINNVITFFSELPNKIGYAIGFAIGTLIRWCSNVISWVKTNVPKIISSIVNFFKELPGKIWTFLVNIVTKIGTWCVNMKNKAVNGITTLITNVVTFFRELPGKIWSAIVGAVERISAWGSQMKSKAVNAIKTLVSNVVSTAKSLPGKIWSAISGAIDKITTWGSNMLSKAKTAIKNVATAITDGLKSIPSKLGSIGRDIVEGLWNGIKNATSWIKEKVGGFAKGILSGMKDALEINSPSKLFAREVGSAIPEGVAKGIDDNTDFTDKAVDDMIEDLVNQANSINGATIQRKLATTFNVGATGADKTNTALLSKLDGIYERLNRLQIVLDTGTLVGETIDKIDSGLATRQLLSARGV